MKRIILTLFLIIFGASSAFCYEADYKQIYMDLQVPNFSYLHGIDPGQYFDNKSATYSVYPLFRLCTPLFFKTITIQPGYYALTPKNFKDDEYILFKENGLIKHIIPVYKKEIVPQDFYETHLPKPKLTWSQSCSQHFYGFIGEHFKSAKRKPPIKTYLEVNELDNKFVSVVVYYGPYRYYTLFRTVQM